jgi:hypothetical protein
MPEFFGHDHIGTHHYQVVPVFVASVINLCIELLQVVFSLFPKMCRYHCPVGNGRIFYNGFKERGVGEYLAKPAVEVIQMPGNLLHLRSLVNGTGDQQYLLPHQ